MDLGVGLPRVLGDQVALQQVVLNLVMNAVEAMSTMQDCARVLVIQTGREEGAALRVAVQDSGIQVVGVEAPGLFQGPEDDPLQVVRVRVRRSIWECWTMSIS